MSLNLPRARVYGSASSPAAAAIAGRLRVVDRRFQNDAGWFSCRCVSDLAALGFVLHGRGDELWRRFDRYQRAGKTMVRVLGMLADRSWVSAGLDFSPRTPGYADARERLVAEANARGLYVKFDLFADAQIAVPSASERRSMTLELAAFCRTHPGVLPGLSNEPYKNGWTSATDPALLALADDFAGAVGHRDFSIGDVGDDDAEASPEIAEKMIEIARRCNVVAWHPSRSFDPKDKRWRRYLDHLEGVTDIIPRWRPGVALFVEEPIGASLQVIPGRRDNDPDAFVAAQFISLLCGFAAYTYHWIPGELDVDQLPGFFAATDVLARVPTSPEWRYLNDSWPGSPTDGITWPGKEGKMRSLVRGTQAWTVAYGDGDFDNVRWRPGFTPRVEYASARVRVWSVNQ